MFGKDISALFSIRQLNQNDVIGDLKNLRGPWITATDEIPFVVQVQLHRAKTLGSANEDNCVVIGRRFRNVFFNGNDSAGWANGKGAKPVMESMKDAQGVIRYSARSNDEVGFTGSVPDDVN
jgi:hypothetical protein